MRLVFAGTPEFAAVALRELLRRKYEVLSVLTQPDRSAGRGLKTRVGPVKAVALEHGIAVQQAPSLKDPAVQRALGRLRADAFVVAAYGLILPPAVLELPRLGCLNIHASLLPRWRGAAPIQRAIMAGDRETGISIMRMDEGLDTGPVLLRATIPIEPEDTGGSLHDRLAQLGALTICDALEGLAGNTVASEKQSTEGACYAAKLRREDTQVDWARPAIELERLLRALDPSPGAFTHCDGQVLKLWRAAVVPGTANVLPGTVVAVGPQGIAVRCLDANLLLTEVQRPGGRRMSAAEFLRGQSLALGLRLVA